MRRRDLLWGQGDFTKGKVVRLRVSDLSACNDFAKQIRVMGKEHMLDAYATGWG